MALKCTILLVAAVSTAMAVPLESIGRATATNSTISCNWSSATELVGDIQANKLNVTDAVAQCANICSIAFAPDNPDISKEGIFISCLIQVALASVFGPLLSIFIWVVNSFFGRNLDRWIPLLHKLQHSIYEINGYFCISILVAAITLHHQDPSILEITFTSLLLSMQLMLTVNMIWAQYGDHSMNSKSDTELGGLWFIYYIAIIIGQIIVSSVIGLPDGTVSAYKQLAEECHKQQNLVDISSYLGTISNGSSAGNWVGIGLGIGIVGGIIICVLAIPLKGLFKKIAAVIPKWLKKHGLNILLSTIILFYMALVILDTVILGEFREKWKSMRMGQVQAEDWGYGQTTAILLWASFLWVATKETFKHWREPPSPPPPPAEAEMQTLDEELGQPQMTEAIPPPYTHGNGPPPSFTTT